MNSRLHLTLKHRNLDRLAHKLRQCVQLALTCSRQVFLWPAYADGHLESAGPVATAAQSIGHIEAIEAFPQDSKAKVAAPVCPPSVWAVILGWKRQSDTVECVRSLMKADYPNLGVVLVDNASRDGTPERVKACYPAVNLILNSDNLGFAAGNNVGIEYALRRGAEYVFLLNNDSVVAADALGALVNVGEADWHIGLLTPKIYFYHDRAKIWSAGGRKAKLLPGLARIGFGKDDGPAYDEQREVDYATGCGMLVKSEVFREVGLFDTGYFMYFEDCDLSLRVRRAGYSIVYVPRAIVWHKDRFTTSNTPATKWYYLAKSTVSYCQRYSRLPWASILAYVGWLMMRECVKGHYNVIAPCLQGLRDGLSDTRPAGTL